MSRIFTTVAHAITAAISHRSAAAAVAMVPAAPRAPGVRSVCFLRERWRGGGEEGGRLSVAGPPGTSPLEKLKDKFTTEVAAPRLCATSTSAPLVEWHYGHRGHIRMTQATEI